MSALMAWFRRRLPSSLGRRIRWLFALFAGLVAILAIIGLPAAEAPPWPDQALALVLLTALACWPWVHYRFEGLPAVLDPAPMLGVLGVGWLLGNPAYVFGLTFVLLYGRALEASPRRVWLNAIGYFAAYEGAAALTLGVGELAQVSTLTMALGVALSTAVMWLLGDVIRSHEAATARAALLARWATSIQRSDEPETVYGTAVDAALELVRDVPDAAVSVWRGNDQLLRVDGHGGDVPSDLPFEVPLELIPDDLRTALLAGEPFALDVAEARAVQRSLGMAPVLTSILIAPFSHASRFGGALAVGSRAPLDEELVTALGRLAADVGLALDRLESEQRFRSLAENVSEGMYRMALHPVPRYEYVNPAMERMTGFPFARYVEDPDLTLRQVHPEDRETIVRTREAPHEMTWPVEVRWCHPEEGWKWASLTETVVYGKDGTALSSMGIISDITSRKQQEEALRNALDNERRVAEELRRLDTMKTTFLQAVSHELRTPLTSIKGYAKTLARNHTVLDDETRARLLDRLDLNADKLDRLLTDLLDLDRMSSGLLVPARRPTDVAELCRRVIEQIDQTTHVLLCDAAPIVADVDPPKVERIVENLVRNAIKHTEPGTEVVVDVEPRPDVDGVEITVSDGGGGVPDELRESIFEPFVQGPDSATAPRPGTGIGLSLVARFAELHGGRAWYEAGRDGGARFHVLLPGGALAEPADPTLVDPATVAPAELRETPRQ